MAQAEGKEGEAVVAEKKGFDQDEFRKSAKQAVAASVGNFYRFPIASEFSLQCILFCFQA